LKYHPDCSGCLTDDVGTLSGGEFDWGGRLLKSNGGVYIVISINFYKILK